MSSFRSRQRSQSSRHFIRPLDEAGTEPQAPASEPVAAPSRAPAPPEARPHGRAPVAIRAERVSAMFAPCPRGLEGVLAEELAALGATSIDKRNNGVAFCGDNAVMMRANLESRTASRILIQLAQGPYRSEQDVYKLALTIDWPRWFAVGKTIKVKTDGVGSALRSLDFISLKVKDAVCDRFRQADLGRPSVDTRYPDVRIHVFLSADQATVYIDSSGEPLFKRGWREDTGEAPLRENLAAGILLLAGYDGSQALLDPMMGSGTFLVEAADIALNRAPGRLRDFAFRDLRSFDAVEWESVQARARQAEKPLRALPIRGSDVSVQMLVKTRHNLKQAGLHGLVQIAQSDVLDTRPHAETGLIVTNPPYGVRLDEQEDLALLYPQLGGWLKQYFSGWTANFFTGDLRLAKLIRLSPKQRMPLFNGALDCRLFVIPMVAGSNRVKDAAGG